MEQGEPGSSSPQMRPGTAFASVIGRLVRLFPWHVGIFFAANAAISTVNAFTGPPWWGLWPLLVTGALLGGHYLVYKAAAIDERWVDARIEELNLKSYDRSHIENLKARHSVQLPDQDR